MSAALIYTLEKLRSRIGNSVIINVVSDTKDNNNRSKGAIKYYSYDDINNIETLQKISDNEIILFDSLEKFYSSGFFASFLDTPRNIIILATWSDFILGDERAILPNETGPEISDNAMDLITKYFPNILLYRIPIEDIFPIKVVIYSSRNADISGSVCFVQSELDNGNTIMVKSGYPTEETTNKNNVRRILFTDRIPLQDQRTTIASLPSRVDTQIIQIPTMETVNRATKQYIQVPVTKTIDRPTKQLVTTPTRRTEIVPVKQIVNVPVKRIINVPVKRMEQFDTFQTVNQQTVERREVPVVETVRVPSVERREVDVVRTVPTIERREVDVTRTVTVPTVERTEVPITSTVTRPVGQSTSVGPNGRVTQSQTTAETTGVTGVQVREVSSSKTVQVPAKEIKETNGTTQVPGKEIREFPTTQLVQVQRTEMRDFPVVRQVQVPVKGMREVDAIEQREIIENEQREIVSTETREVIGSETREVDGVEQVQVQDVEVREIDGVEQVQVPGMKEEELITEYPRQLVSSRLDIPLSEKKESLVGSSVAILRSIRTLESNNINGWSVNEEILSLKAKNPKMCQLFTLLAMKQYTTHDIQIIYSKHNYELIAQLLDLLHIKHGLIPDARVIIVNSLEQLSTAMRDKSKVNSNSIVSKVHLIDSYNLRVIRDVISIVYKRSYYTKVIPELVVAIYVSDPDLDSLRINSASHLQADIVEIDEIYQKLIGSAQILQ